MPAPLINLASVRSNLGVSFVPRLLANRLSSFDLIVGVAGQF